MAKSTLVQTGSRTPLITKSTFKGYDLCLNPYVGCEFGCKYCYVRFFITDRPAAAKQEREPREWGDFVRVREHVHESLPKELAKGFFRIEAGKKPIEVQGMDLTDKEKQKVRYEDGQEVELFTVNRRTYNAIPTDKARIVIGTMTDPYMPLERKHRITRAVLEQFTKMPTPFHKVGLFTRSPIVLEDLDLIQKLPKGRVHFSITPHTREVMKMIEPIAVRTDTRFKTIKTIMEAGVRVHVNVAPAIPIVSDLVTEEMAQMLSEAAPNEFFIDPMQPYDQSFDATKESLEGQLGDWGEIETIMKDPEMFQAWKDEYRESWQKTWETHGNSTTLPIWCDHVNHVWENLATGEKLDPRNYHGDLTWK